MSRIIVLCSLFACCAASLAIAGRGGAPEAPPSEGEMPPVATFSIVAYDPETRDFGVAVQSRFLAVGWVVPWAKAGVGVVATQAAANTSYGPKGLELLEQGLSAEEVVKRLTDEDTGSARRQVGVVDSQGRAAAFTGASCGTWAGHVVRQHFAVQGNILAGEAVVQEMARAYEAAEGTLAERLMAAMDAGQAAGGDRRGQQSASLNVVRAGGGYDRNSDRLVDIRVDDHAEPLTELRRIFGLWKRARRGG